MTPTIDRLPELVEALPSDVRKAFRRIFSIDVVHGELCPPPLMLTWIENQFGGVERVKRQAIVKITNIVSGESSVFNPLRSLRPHHFKREVTVHGTSTEQVNGDLFADPMENTTEDVFGRVEGKYCVTAANIAKYEQYHCVVVFNNPGPLDFGCTEVADYLETGWRWIQKAHAHDKDARYGLFLWNCTNRAGASVPHGHAQVILGRGGHYGKIEQLRGAAAGYKNNYKSDYFADLYDVHEALGLGWRCGETRIMAYLAALKQNEVMLLGDRLDQSMKEGIYSIVSGFRDKLYVKSFNLGLAFPPLGRIAGWKGFPLVARVVDRGDTSDISSDIGAMELYGANVISSDPFHTAAVIGNGPQQSNS
jgi:hypothetical protein